MKKNLTVITAVSVLFLAGCASSKIDHAKFDKSFESGQYAVCAEMLEKTKAAENIDTAIDISLLKNYAGDYKGSSASFEVTNQALDDAFTKSITKGLAAAVGNENAKEALVKL